MNRVTNLTRRLRLFTFILLTLSFIVPQSIVPHTQPSVALAAPDVGFVEAYVQVRDHCTNEFIDDAELSFYDESIGQSENSLIATAQTYLITDTYVITNTTSLSNNVQLGVRVRRDGYADVYQYLGSYNATTEGQTITGIEVTLQNATVVVEGTVYDNHYDEYKDYNYTDDDTPLEGATVILETPGENIYEPGDQMVTTTDKDGKYRFLVARRTANELYTNVKASKDGFTQSQQYIWGLSPACSNNTTTQDFRLTPGHTFKMTLLNEKTNEPIANTNGFVRLYRNGSFNDGATVFLDATGTGSVTFPYYAPYEKLALLFTDIPDYAGQFLGQNGVGVATLNEAQTWNGLPPRGVTNLGSVKLYQGVKLIGHLFDAHTNEPIVMRYNPYVSIYNPDGNFLNNVGFDYDGTTNNVTSTQRVLPGTYLLGWNDGTGDFLGFVNGKEHHYINHYYTAQTGMPPKEAYFLGSSDLLHVTGDNNSSVTTAWYFAQCATLSGEVRDHKGNLILPGQISIPDYYGEGRDLTEEGSADFLLNLYDPVSNNAPYWKDTNINADGTYTTTLCHSAIATLDEVMFQFIPGEKREPVFDNPANPSADNWDWDLEYTNYSDVALSYWYNADSSNAYSPRDASKLHIVPGGKYPNINVHFQAGGTVGGTVTDADGKGLEDVGVELYDPTTAWYTEHNTWTDENGVYTITNVAPGSYMLRFNKNGYRIEWYDNVWSQNEAETFAVAVGQKVTKNASLQRFGQLEVTITDKETGKPIEGVEFTMQLYNTDGTSTNKYADNLPDDIKRTGIFTISNIMPGQYKLKIWGPIENWGWDTQWYDGILGDQGAVGQATVIDIPAATKQDEPSKKITAKMQGRYGKGTITGKVFREDTRAPLDFADVLLYDAFSGTFLRVFSTNAMGQYTIDNIQDGSYKLQFGYGQDNLVAEYYNDVLSKDDAATIVVSGTQKVDLKPAYLAPGGQVAVTVKGNGTPLVGAPVWVEGIDTDYSSAWYYTDNQGVAMIYGVPEGNHTAQTNQFNEFEQFISEPFAVAKGKQTNVDINLRTGHRMVGTVTDEQTGLPLPGVKVELYGVDIEQAGTDVATNEDGKFAINGLNPQDKYKVRFSRRGYISEFYNNQPDWKMADTVEVSGTLTLNAAMHMGSDNGILGGRVTLPGGQPAKGVTVKLYDEWGVESGYNDATTDSTGAYLFDMLKEGTYKVQFVPPAASGYLSEWYNDKPNSAEANEVVVTKQAPQYGIDAEMNKADSLIAGTVRVGSTDVPTNTDNTDVPTDTNVPTDTLMLAATSDGKPMRNVTIKQYDAATGDYINQAITNARGQYRLSAKDKRKYKLAATGSSYYSTGTHVPDAIDLSPICDSAGDLVVTDCYAPQWYNLKGWFSSADEVTATVGTTNTANFMLSQAGIAGKVTTEDGKPLKDVGVSFINALTGQFVASASTERDGTYQHTGLGAGIYKVTAEAPTIVTQQLHLAGRAQHPNDVDVRPIGVTPGIDIIFEQQAVMSGTVYITPTDNVSPTLSALPARLPVSNAYVEVYRKGSTVRSASATTNQDGHYLFENLAPGDYQIKVISPRQGVSLGYLPQWFDRVFDQSVATAVTVPKGGMAEQDVYLAKSPRKRPATLKGVVIEDRPPYAPPHRPAVSALREPPLMPLADMELKLYRVDNTGNPVALASAFTTGATGDYAFTGLEAGVYKLFVGIPETAVNSKYRNQWFDKVRDVKFARPIFIQDGATKVVTVTVAPALRSMPVPRAGTGAQWLCEDEQTYDKPPRGLSCVRVRGTANNEMVVIVRELTDFDETNVSLSADEPVDENVTPPTETVAKYFEVTAYWSDSGEAVNNTDSAVEIAVPYTDEDLVYTRTGSVSPTTIAEGRLRARFWNSTALTSTGTVSGTNNTGVGWHDPTVAPWCTDGDCGQSVDADTNHVLMSSDQFFETYALIEGEAPTVYLPIVVQGMTSSVSSTLSLR